MEARSSAWFSVCSDFAASRNVDMERTRYELEEHSNACIAACATVASLPEAVHVYEREASLK
jgi:hypothetical protein